MDTESNPVLNAGRSPGEPTEDLAALLPCPVAGSNPSISRDQSLVYPVDVSIGLLKDLLSDLPRVTGARPAVAR